MNSRKKFDPNQYMGKERIYQAVPSHPRLSRILVWNQARTQYDIPPRGNLFRAARYELSPQGKRERVFMYFDDMAEALNWQAGQGPALPERVIDQGVLFSQVVDDWRKRKLVQKARSTQVAYEKMLKLYFGSLMGKPMKDFTSKAVDDWLDELKDPDGRFMKSRRRVKFDHELSLLSGILRFYREYQDEAFRHPIMARHQDDVLTGRPRRTSKKDIRYPDFQKFLSELKKQRHGDVLSVMATVQYFQALRISEAAAIHWEDLHLDPVVPHASRLLVTRSVIWLRSKGLGSFIRVGFKNSEANDGCKEQPLFPETYFALRSLTSRRKMTGLLFETAGQHFEYRQIEYAYNKAFAQAGLPYRGTHIMRHGGTRLVYNATKDLEVAKQILGNRDLQTVQVYAQRDATALTQFAQERWNSMEVPASVNGNSM